MSWQTVKVGDLITQVRGVSYSSGDAIDKLKDGYIELLRANNIADGYLTFNDVTYVPKSKVTEKQYLKQNDIVIAASSGSISVVGKAASFNASRISTFGAFCKVLRPKENVDARYIANYFQTSTYRRTVSALAEGANINNLRNEHIDNLDIALPPLAEQKRIAEILDKAAEIKAKREQAISKLDKLLQSTFVGMLNEHDTEEFELGELCDMYQPKTISSNELTVDGEFLVYGANGVIGRYDKFNHENPETLITCRGATCGNVNKSSPKSWITGNAMVVRSKSDLVDNDFLYMLFKFNTDFSRVITGAAQPQITRQTLSRLRISIPKIKAQLHVVSTVEGVASNVEKIQKSNNLISDLIKSLQHQAFTAGFNA